MTDMIIGREGRQRARGGGETKTRTVCQESTSEHEMFTTTSTGDRLRVTCNPGKPTVQE